MKIVKLSEVPIEDRGQYSIRRLFTEKLHHNPKNVGLYETTIPPGEKVSYHYHANLDEVIIFVTNGRMKIGDEMHNFSPGDLVYLDSGSVHEIYADEIEVKLFAIKLPDIKDDKVLPEKS